MKLFFTDLDGTLLNPEHQTDNHILDGMETVRKRGHFVVPCTGRPRNLMTGFSFAPGPMVCSNGAILYDEQGEVFDKRPIAPEVMTALLKTFPDIPFECCTENAILCTHGRDRLRTEFNNRWGRRNIHKTEEDFNLYFSGLKTDVPPAEIAAAGIIKINLNNNHDLSSRQLADWIDACPGIINNPSDDILFELTSPEADKSFGIRRMMDHFQTDEIFVFGDGHNDLNMLSMTENSYSPSAGHPDAVKTAAHTLDSRNPHCVIDKILELSA